MCSLPLGPRWELLRGGRACGRLSYGKKDRVMLTFQLIQKLVDCHFWGVFAAARAPLGARGGCTRQPYASLRSAQGNLLVNSENQDEI